MLTATIENDVGEDCGTLVLLLAGDSAQAREVIATLSSIADRAAPVEEA